MLSSASVRNADDGREPIGSTDRRGAVSREEALAESALLHAMRAASFRAEAERYRGAGARPRGWLPRTDWAQTAIARLEHRAAFARLVMGRTVRSVREDGAGVSFRRVLHHTIGTPLPVTARPAERLPGVPESAGEIDVATSDEQMPVQPRADYRSTLARVYGRPIAEPAASVLAHRVLLVGETTLPQCAKYRVWQKKAHFERLGLQCLVIDWRHWIEAVSRLQARTLLVLYRVPLFPDMRTLVREARRLKVQIVWEVDDLIFDIDLYSRNANLVTVPEKERAELLHGVKLYRDAMMASDRTIASTTTLARLMEEATGRPSHVIENALDRETLDFAAQARRAAAGREADGRIVVFYGSGTTTHDADIAVAADALATAMREDPRIVFRVVGPLTLPASLVAHGDRVERLPLTDYKNYLAELARADISIAPLEPTIFNDAKSNIKLIEAAIVGVPSVCSPAVEFRKIVTDRVDGFLAGTDEEWVDAIRTLANDASCRRSVAAASERAIMQRYAPDQVALGSVAPIASLMPDRRNAGFRILVVNIYYAPRSLGGATIVAEEMVRRLHGRDDTEVFVFTTHERHTASQYSMCRYVDGGVPVLAVAPPLGYDAVLAFDDPEMGRAFTDALDAVRPDIVHFHSVQHLGAGLLRACQAAAIPYVVTLHDAWWVCPRQFMVRGDNTYCHQTTIDLKVCQPCVPEIAHLQSRMNILMQGLDEAALLLSPSESHAALYRANGIPAWQIRVNRNGVRRPSGDRGPRTGPIRFAFVGGNNAIKGIKLIREAFATLDRSDWALRLVDASLALGFPSIDRSEWRLSGSVEIVPAYTQDEIDAFYADVDVLLFPSQWKESFGLTVREALLRDVWVIATESGAAAEDVVDGVNGTLIPMRNDRETLARAIEAVLDRKDAIRAHRNPHASRIATLDAQADELYALLREAASANRPAPRLAV